MSLVHDQEMVQARTAHRRDETFGASATEDGLRTSDHESVAV
jgi:hypothetical protein